MDSQTIEQYLDMFLSPAWKDLKESLENDLEVLNRADNLSNEKELFFTQGQVAIIRDILSLEDRLKSADNN